MDADVKLMLRYAETRDALAFTELTRRYRGLVFAAARRVTGNHHDAEDVAQSCFVELARRAGTLTGSLPGWLHLQATSRAIDLVRSGSRRRIHEAKAADDESLSTGGDEATWEMIGPVVDEAIERLPDHFRLPLILHYLQGFTQEEVAEALDVSRRTLCRRLQEAVVELRRQMSRVGVTVVATAVLALLLNGNALLAAPSTLNVSLAKIGLAGIGHRGSAAVGLAERLNRVAALLFAAARWPRFVQALMVVIFAAALTLAWSRWSPTDRRSRVYDAVVAANAPYLDATDPFGTSTKVRSIATDRIHYWRGTKDLFFAWCKEHAADWAADRGAFVTTNGDLHLGSIGTYATAGGSFGTLSVGLVDVDESCRVPFQVELLQATIALRLVAADNRLDVSDANRHRLLNELKVAYAEALANPSEGRRQLRASDWLARMEQRGLAQPYEEKLLDFVGPDGRFVAMTRGEQGTRDVLRTAQLDRTRLAAALAEVIASSPRLSTAFRVRGAGAVASSIKDVARRTHVGAADVQGLDCYLVLLDRPLVDVEHDVIVSLTRAVPSAAERAGYVPVDARLAAQRRMEHRDELSATEAFLFAPCELDGRSYLLELIEPWSDELHTGRIRSIDDLMQAARLVGLAGGASHAKDPNAAALAGRLTSPLLDAIDARATAYVAKLEADLDDLRDDARTKADIHAAAAAAGGTR